jgi:hypothetical protein
MRICWREAPELDPLPESPQALSVNAAMAAAKMAFFNTASLFARPSGADLRLGPAIVTRVTRA